jgi:hypothetical protein
MSYRWRPLRLTVLLTYVSQMELIASMGGSHMASLITSASTKQHLDEREQTKKGRP